MAAATHDDQRSISNSYDTDKIVDNLFTDRWHSHSQSQTPRGVSTITMGIGISCNFNKVDNQQMITIGRPLTSSESYLAVKPSLSKMICDNNNGYQLWRAYPDQTQHCTFFL